MEILLRLFLSWIFHPVKDYHVFSVNLDRLVLLFILPKGLLLDGTKGFGISLVAFLHLEPFAFSLDSVPSLFGFGGWRGCKAVVKWTHKYTQMTLLNHWRVKNDLDSFRISLSEENLPLGMMSGRMMGDFSKFCSSCVPNHILFW